MYTLILKFESYSAVCLCYLKMLALLTKKICKEGICGTDQTTAYFRYSWFSRDVTKF